MTRFEIRVLIAVLLAAGSALMPSAAAAGDAVLRRFNSGAGADAVGMVDASEDTEVAGPQAIYAGEGNEVFLLDQVNGRVLSFDTRQPDAQTRAFRLPEALEPTDLVVQQGRDLRVGRQRARAQADRTGRRSDARARRISDARDR